MYKNEQLVSFDYAIKYLLRDKANYDVVEGFISALLQDIGYKSVKIAALLEAESNREEHFLKRSIADLIVEDEDQNKYIVEIERTFSKAFLHKSIFNSSRLIVDNINQSANYTKIVKVFHISLLYFELEKEAGAIYHGKTILNEVVSNRKLAMVLADRKNGACFCPTDIFPEYIYISIPQFNDVLEKEIDDWLYVMKNSAIPKTYKSKYMEIVREKLNFLKMTQEQRDEYIYYQKKIVEELDKVTAAEEKGKAVEKIEIAKNLIKQDVVYETISIATGLSVDEIHKLKD